MSWPTIPYEPPPIYFMHVRKRAGTAWHNVLKGDAQLRRTYSIAPRLRAISQWVTTVGGSALRRLAKTTIIPPLRQVRRYYQEVQGSSTSKES